PADRPRMEYGGWISKWKWRNAASARWQNQKRISVGQTMAAADERRKLWTAAAAWNNHAGWTLQGELVRPVRSRRQCVGMVRRHIQRRKQRNRPRLGSFARRIMGDD